MAKPVLLLDFFGTLVDYSPSRTEQGYHRSHAVVTGAGSAIGYDDFLAVWSAVSVELDERSAGDDREYSMHEAATAALARILGRPPQPDDTADLIATYLAEWNTGVRYPAWATSVVAALAQRYRLAVVTNTHQPDLVPGHLAAMGIADRFEAVVTSVEVGWRKPRPEIYAQALDQLGVPAGDAIFVGDSFGPDFTGPRAIGMTAYLIDPTDRHRVAPAYRLSSLADLPVRLGVCGRPG